MFLGSLAVWKAAIIKPPQVCDQPTDVGVVFPKECFWCGLNSA